MATLNIMCVICSEFYKVTDTVYSTTVCGHLFHKQCLLRWLSTSRTCPQCRQSCHQQHVHRVFLNFSQPTELDKELDAICVDDPIWQYLDLPPQAHSQLTLSPPANGLQSGTGPSGEPIYVARVPFREDLLPANYVPSKGCCHVPWGCRAHTLNLDYMEYLVDDGRYAWVAAANGSVPSNAVVVGSCNNGANLYTGRGQHRGVTYPGKVHPSHHVLYMPVDGMEENSREYEVLVRLDKEKTASATSSQTNPVTSPISE